MYFLLIIVIFYLSNFLIWIVGICNGWDLIYEFDGGTISAIMKFIFIDKF